jgi:hypothetical protein
MVSTVPDGGDQLLLSVPCLNQEVRTVMTVAAMGAAHNPKSIIPTPVVAG